MYLIVLLLCALIAYEMKDLCRDRGGGLQKKQEKAAQKFIKTKEDKYSI